ncbi:hypothetical protein N9Q85_00140 [Flavobacteriaceae bacterium]|jgi:hypothetical protein|nr:hypothetical protein [Flavobacteriaceae bacterium]|tara:strand:- start:73 stop:225 length:153 start_codon:yes stop_codon:yes gene_type:complete
MEFLKKAWIVSIVLFTIYFVNEYLEKGFDSLLFATGVAIVVSGIGFLKRE